MAIMRRLRFEADAVRVRKTGMDVIGLTMAKSAISVVTSLLN